MSVPRCAIGRVRSGRHVPRLARCTCELCCRTCHSERGVCQRNLSMSMARCAYLDHGVVCLAHSMLLGTDNCCGGNIFLNRLIAKLPCAARSMSDLHGECQIPLVRAVHFSQFSILLISAGLGFPATCALVRFRALQSGSATPIAAARRVPPEKLRSFPRREGMRMFGLCRCGPRILGIVRLWLPASPPSPRTDD